VRPLEFGRPFVFLALACCLAPPVAIGSQASHADPPFSLAGHLDSPRLAQLGKAPNSKAVASFWTEITRNGTPLVEAVAGEPGYSWVTFLWRAKEKTTNVVVVDGVAAGVGGVDARNSQMSRLGRTDIWYRTYKVRNDAAFSYTLSPNDSLERFAGPRTSKPQLDPLNPNRSGPQSSVRLPSAPSAIEYAPLLAGRISPASFTSTVLQNTRDLQVYTPPNFAAEGRRYPLLVVLDSGAYGDYIPVPSILDRLIAEKRMSPIVAVLVANVSRAEELQCSPRFADFLAIELVPWMRKTYGAGATSDQTIVSGASLGGLASMFAAFQHPEVFGNVLSQSGSFWWTPAQDGPPEWLTGQFAAAPARGIRVSMSVGAMEIPQQRDTNQRLRQVLTEKGYRIDYSEFNGNHSYFSWRADFAQQLVNLVGP
jgi:enterochelin esterase family protein